MDIEKILEKNKDISHLSGFNTPAKTQYYYEIHNRQNIETLSKIYTFAQENNLQILLIGWGTNLLFAFDMFEGIIVNNCLKWWNFNSTTKELESYSSEFISDIAEKLYNDWERIWKRFIWLPWSVWWAVFWNAWCFWLETENNFVEAELYNFETGKFEILNKSQMQFEYRNSIVKKTGKYIIVKVKFNLSEVIEKYSSQVDNIHFREHKQPKWYTCGSFFKNPSKDSSAWMLIEKVWLKWHKLWWAYFSDLHANFLMNDGTAHYSDLLELVELAQKQVHSKFNIDLIPEVRIIS